MSNKRALLLSLLVSLLWVSASFGQTREEVLRVDGARPVGEAVLELTRNYPVTVTYEDPRYEFEGDLRDITNRKNPNAPDRRVLVPRGGNLEVRFNVLVETNRPTDLAGTLTEILEYHRLSGFPGHFAILQTGEAFHIVPTEVRGANGRWIPQTSIMATPITIKAQEINGFDAVDLVADKVEEGIGIFVGIAIGRCCANAVLGSTIQLEANAEPARDVLLRTLQSIAKDRLTWGLNYAADTQRYYLNLRAVPAQPSPVTFDFEPSRSGKSFFDRPEPAPDQ